MDQLIYDEESQEELKKWISERTKVNYPNSICIGLARDGVLIACVCYQCFKDGVFVHIALDKPLTKAFLKVIFDYPFNKVKTDRIIGLVPKDNLKAIKLNEKLGFRLMQHDETMVYQMVKNECKWLKE